MTPVQARPYLRLKWRLGERDEEREREPALEDELFSFMKTLRFPNLVGKPFPRVRPAPAPPPVPPTPPRGAGGPKVLAPTRCCEGCCCCCCCCDARPEGTEARGEWSEDTSHRFFLGLSEMPSLPRLERRARVLLGGRGAADQGPP